MPFVVRKADDNTMIRVLGTSFNVNAYDDERALKVTLLDGMINVSNGTVSNVLKPGQQAQLSNGNMLLVNNVNMEDVMAWKNGRFHFEGTDIKTIMNQVGKWYDVEVEYQADIPFSFVANIQRDVKVSELLKLLSLTDLVHFRIEGNKIIVMK
jgi:ferric-dicitrate binding protein FerR (iron transport regulator)